MPDMDFQKIVLNLIPKQGDAPVVFYASQYETARPFIADLFWGETEFVPGADCWAEIDIRKNDDNLLVITDDVTIDNNEVSVVLPVQAVTCIGKNLGQIKIFADADHMVAAFNFILEVQPDPLAGGVQSETAIDNLESQIAAIVPEVIGNDYYNKTETDALLSDKADVSDLPDMTDYYTKSETDTLLNAKANTSDLATLASKAEVTQAINDEDTLIRNWVSSNFATPGYVASHYYNKTQVDNLLFNMLPVGSASGNPCTFDTDLADALVSLTADIVCGGGGGTPSNPIPIVGYSELNLDVNGDTFTISFGQTVYGGVYDKSGRLTITHGYIEYDGSNDENWRIGTAGAYTRMMIARSDAYDSVSRSEVVCNIGQYASSGNDYYMTFLYNADIFYYPPAEVTTIEDFRTWLSSNNLKIAYPLATPIEIDVQAISPSAVVGANNIISDCNGDVNVSYKDSIQHYIDTRG